MTDPVMDKRKNLSKTKILVFSFVPLLILIGALELGLRAVYYQMHGMDFLAIAQTFKKLERKLQSFSAQKEAAETFRKLPTSIGSALFEEEGKELLSYFEHVYEDNFASLVKESNKLGAKLIVSYVPGYLPDLPDPQNLAVRKIHLDFYKALSAKYGVDFIDLNDPLSKFPGKAVYLMPENGHLSRFGNQLIAERLSQEIGRYSDHRMQTVFSNRPKLFGDLRPQESGMWLYSPTMPYLVGINSQGLRMDQDLQFPKQKQRILFLGDSYTFGPYLVNHDTIPGLLQKKFPDKEFINAGVCGYTITDEASLFSERAKFCEPDIVMLQVVNNDLSDLFYFQRQRFARNPESVKPTKQEQEYINKLRQLEK